LLELLENWLQNCYSCIKWTHVLSATFQIRFGIRQGSVLSPFLFAIYLDVVLAGLPQWELDRVQSVVNAAARLSADARKYDHVTPLLMDLH